MADNEKFHLGLCAVWWSVLFVAAMWLMLVTAQNKMIVIADGVYGKEAAAEGAGTGHAQKLGLEHTGEGDRIFLIPLEEDVKPGDVAVENCYMDQELHIFIKGAHDEFYEGHPVQGNVSSIQDAYREKQRSGMLLRLGMDDIYEYRTSMDGNILRVEVYEPHEMYQLLVVIDPAGGGPIGDYPDVAAYRNQMAAEIVLDVGKLIPGKLSDENIRIYLTRTEDAEISPKQRAALVEAVGADLFLHLDTSSDEDTAKYGIRGYYNESYFIPGFGNVEFADAVTRNVTIACGNRAIGLEAAGEDSILQDIRIPAAGIDLGYMTNGKESTLLAQESYKEKLAEGIAGAIREVYTNYYEKIQ